MDKIIKDTLEQLGLTAKEIKFFEACFRLGPTTINEAARLARLERSTAYLIAQELLIKGLLEEDFKQYRKTIIASDPQKLLRLLSAKQRIVRRAEIAFEERLPELEALYKTSEIRPHVKVFTGEKAIYAVWADALSATEEILLWTNQKTESLFFSKALHEKFIKERIRKQIPIRALAVNNQPGKKLLEKDNLSLRHSKLLPLHTSFDAETYIYHNKLSILDYKKNIIGIIVESESIAQTQRAIFALTWDMIAP